MMACCHKLRKKNVVKVVPPLTKHSGSAQDFSVQSYPNASLQILTPCAMGWSVVCDYGISWSNPLIFNLVIVIT